MSTTATTKSLIITSDNGLVDGSGNNKDNNTPVTTTVALNSIIRDIHGNEVTAATKYYWSSASTNSSGYFSFEGKTLNKNPNWVQTNENQASWELGGVRPVETKKSDGIKLPNFITNLFGWIYEHKVFFTILLAILLIILL